MTGIGNIVASFQLNIDNFTANLKKAEEQIKKVEDNFSGYDAIGSKFTNIGTKLTAGLTVPLAGAAVGATKLASDFEAKLSQVQATAGATAEDMEMLKQKSLEMGASTSFSAGESADAMNYMAMAGWDASQMVSGISGIMDLAAASGEDLAMVSNIVTDSMTAFGLSAKDSGDFANVLAAAAASANTDVAMLGESFKYVAPVAGALGYNVEDTSLALGLMSNAGIKAGQAGTTLRAALTRMVDPTKEVAALMDEYGLSLTNSDGSMKTLNEVMGDLRSSFGGLSEAEQTQAATSLFGQEAMSGMLAVINAGEDDFNKLNTAIYNSDGVAASMADTMQDNFKGSVEALGGAVETLAIQIGDVLIPFIRQAADTVSGWVEKFTGLSEGSKKVIVVIGLLAASIGPLNLAIGLAIKSFGSMQSNLSILRKGFTKLKDSQKLAAVQTKIMTAAQTALNTVMSLSPTTWIIIGIVALIAVFVLLWKKCEGFREFWINLWDVVKQTASDVWEWLKTVFVNAWDDMKTGWVAFKQGFIDLWNSVKDWFINMWDALKDKIGQGIDAIVGLWTGLYEAIARIWDSVKIYFEAWWNIVKTVFGGALLLLIDLLTGDFTKMKEDIAKIWNTIKENFQVLWDGIQLIFVTVVNAIKNFLVGTWEAITNTIKTVWTNIKNFFSQLWTDITTGIVNMWTSVWKFFGNLWTNIKNGVVNAWEFMKTSIKTKSTEAVNWVVTTFNSLVNWLRNLPSNLRTIGSNMFTKMREGISSTIGNIRTTIVNGVNYAVQFLKDLPGQAITWGKHMIEGFIDGMFSKLYALRDGAKNIASNIRDFLGFSIPKKGPLHVYMDWMPHMIQGMTASLKNESPLLYNAANDVAGNLSASMSASPTIAPQVADTSSSFAIAELTSTLKEFMATVGTPTAVFNIDGRQFATATAGDISKALAERMR